MQLVARLLIASANATGFLCISIWVESLILSGTLLVASSALLILLYAVAVGHIHQLIYLFFRTEYRV